MYQYKRILVPLDGSTRAEKALKPALQLAKVMSAEVILVRVTQTFKSVAPFVRIDLPLKEVLEQQQKQASSYLKGVRMLYWEEKIAIKTALITGRPAESIIRYATENQTDLIVLSSHGGTGIGRWRYGEVAIKLLLNAPCSTLVVRADDDHQPLEFKRMLIPLDGSKEAEKTLEPAVAIANQMGAKIILFCVAEPIHMGAGEEKVKSVAAKIMGQAEHYLQNVRKKWVKIEPNISIQVETGPVAQSILEFAQNQSVDLIALSDYGASEGMTLHLGGTADKVIRGARRAVLLVRLNNAID